MMNMFPDKHDRAACAGLARGRAGGGLLCHRVQGDRGGGGGHRPCVDTGPDQLSIDNNYACLDREVELHCYMWYKCKQLNINDSHIAYCILRHFIIANLLINLLKSMICHYVIIRELAPSSHVEVNCNNSQNIL